VTTNINDRNDANEACSAFLTANPFNNAATHPAASPALCYAAFSVMVFPTHITPMVT
jgi:hypothetical protein